MGAELREDGNPGKSPRRAHVIKRLRRARTLVEEEYDRPLTLADIAAAAFMSEAHFVRQFRSEFGITPYRYLTERRLLAAKTLLEETAMPITDIVPTAGFGNRSAFSRLFKSRFGLSPQAYRQSKRHRHRTHGVRTGLPRLAGILTLLVALATPLFAAADPGDTPAPPPPTCDTEAHRAFDFWVGDWEVYANGQLAGRNQVRSRHGGCVVEENWSAAGGAFTGSSLNIYDAARNRWHQSWTDSSGTLLQLDGGVEDGRMIMTGHRPAKDGNGKVTHRITWSRNDDGSVRQQWEATRDGEQWQSLFDGEYRRAD